MNLFAVVHTVCAIFIALTVAPAWGKVGDCAPIVESNVKYLSHANYVHAVNNTSGKTIWKTVLFTETYAREYNAKLEEDGQWNIACVKQIARDDIVATDSRRRTFRLNKWTGKVTSVVTESK